MIRSKEKTEQGDRVGVQDGEVAILDMKSEKASRILNYEQSPECIQGVRHGGVLVRRARVKALREDRARVFEQQQGGQWGWCEARERAADEVIRAVGPDSRTRLLSHSEELGVCSEDLSRGVMQSHLGFFY